MNGLRRTFSFRKKSKKRTETATDTSKPQQWLDDEAKIKDGCCSFQVKYLGNIEVYESRGMQVCEEAIKALRKSKKKPQKAILYVSGDALRVSDDVSQHLIVDQTIEKVSFCAPDRGHEKGFAYICRDGATRRWMCHAFLAVKESGERLSHAVGCAFAICLEKKQKRERDALQLATSEDRNFTRVSSFRPASLVERLIDPQSTILTEPPTSAGDTRTPAIAQTPAVGNSPASPATLTGAIPRPRPSPSITERQSSLRLFPKLQDVSPFKRDLSLRLEELPSNLQRLARITNGDAIPEETGTEVDEPLSKTTHPSLSAAGCTSTTPAHPIATSRGQPCVDVTDLDELVSFSPTSTAAPSSIQSYSTTSSSNAAAFTSTSTTTATTTTTTAPMASSFFTDPFSAAPFNPATIQQHQSGMHPPGVTDPGTKEAASKQLSVWTSNTVTSSAASSITAVGSSSPTSPFLGGPPIAAPRPTPTFSTTTSPWHNNGSIAHYTAHSLASPGLILTPSSGPGIATSLTASYQSVSPQLSFVYQAYPGAPPTPCLLTTTQSPFASQTYSTVYPGTAVAIDTSRAFTSLGGHWSSGGTPRTTMATEIATATGASPWQTSVPSLLPPEPDRFADPFDVGWADRATAAFASPGPTSLHKPGNPFLSDPTATTKPDAMNGHEVKTNPTSSPVKEDPFS